MNVWDKKNDFSHITHFFIIKQTTKLFLKTNHEVLIMNCTYKINWYNMSLMIVSEQIALHINFYVDFDFMTHEETSDYFWMLQQLRIMYVDLKLLDLIVIIIDMKRELMNACESFFQDINHLLCLWHINKNVLTKCKFDFFSEESWNVFYLKWKLMMYSSSEEAFWSSWIDFIQKRRFINFDEMKYLINTYILDFRQRFIKTFIN